MAEKLRGIAAAAEEIREAQRGSLIPIPPQDIEGIIAKHCVDDYLFQTAQAASIKYAGEIAKLTKQVDHYAHGFSHIVADIQATEHAVRNT